LFLFFIFYFWRTAFQALNNLVAQRMEFELNWKSTTRMLSPVCARHFSRQPDDGINYRPITLRKMSGVFCIILIVHTLATIVCFVERRYGVTHSMHSHEQQTQSYDVLINLLADYNEHQLRHAQTICQRLMDDFKKNRSKEISFDSISTGNAKST
jgi:hypothetical protein